MTAGCHTKLNGEPFRTSGISSSHNKEICHNKNAAWQSFTFIIKWICLHANKPEQVDRISNESGNDKNGIGTIPMHFSALNGTNNSVNKK